MKPTKDEILNKYYGGQSISMEGVKHKRIWFDDALKAMQEFAEAYHKEKLRELLPNDEEIKVEFTKESYHYETGRHYKILKDRIFGAKWMRDKIKNHLK